MVRRQLAALHLAAGAVMAVGALTFAQARDAAIAQPSAAECASRGGWISCGAPPDRSVPMMQAMQGKPVTLASAPIDVMASELKFDAAQKKKINAIQDKLEKECRTPPKGPRDPDPSAMFSRTNDLIAQADKDIDAELTAEQKPPAEELLKKLTLLRTTGLPPELYLDLKLTPEQLKSLEEAIPEIKAQNKERSKEMMSAAKSGNMKKVQSLMNDLAPAVVAILTKDQKSLVDKYHKKHPNMMPQMMDFGGFGGFGQP